MPARPSDHIYRHLPRLGWSVGEYATKLGRTRTPSRDGREIRSRPRPRTGRGSRPAGRRWGWRGAGMRT